jgi:hypothetical protein
MYSVIIKYVPKKELQKYAINIIVKLVMFTIKDVSKGITRVVQD